MSVRAIVAACACGVAAASPAPAHGAIVFRGANTASTAAPASALSIPAPGALTVGDVMVATVVTRLPSGTPPTVPAPAGWAPAVETLDTGAPTLRQTTFWKAADAADVAASFTFTFSASARGMGGIAAYTGVDTATPVDTALGASGGGASAAVPRITTANLRANVVVATGWTLNAAVAYDTPTTKRYTGGSTNNGTTEAADFIQTPRAQIPQITATGPGSRWIAQAIALNEMPELTASFPSAYAWPALAPGSTTTSAEQTLSVTSNRSWGVHIVSDRSDGRSREWSGSTYGALALTDPMQWRRSSLAGSAQSTTFADLSGSDAEVTTGQDGATGPVAVGVTFRQKVSYADEAGLPAGHTYRQNVSYIAQQGF